MGKQKNLMKYIVCFQKICFKYFNEAAHLLSAEFMQTGSVWGFLPWYRFKQTMSFSGSGLFYYIFAVLDLIFFKDSKHISSIYMTFLIPSQLKHNRFKCSPFEPIIFSKSTYIIFIFKIFLCHVHPVYVFLILLLAYFCKNCTYITAICFPTMCLVYVILKQDAPEKDTIWKNILLKQEVPEKDTIWKTVLLNQEAFEKIQSAKMFLWNMHPLETDSVCEVAVQSNITKVLRRRI